MFSYESNHSNYTTLAIRERVMFLSWDWIEVAVFAHTKLTMSNTHAAVPCQCVFSVLIHLRICRLLPTFPTQAHWINVPVASILQNYIMLLLCDIPKLNCPARGTKSVLSFIQNRSIWMWQRVITLVVVRITALWKWNVWSVALNG